MLLLCAKCAKRIKKALVVYNGEWFCPHCLHRLFPEGKLQITPANHQKYVESEILFHDGWLLGNVPGERRKSNLDQRKKVLNKALELCHEASCLHHPYALAAMGYYYERCYVDISMGDTERVKFAFQYYSFVLKSLTEDAEKVPTDWKALADEVKNNLAALALDTDPTVLRRALGAQGMAELRNFGLEKEADAAVHAVTVSEKKSPLTGQEIFDKILAEDVCFGIMNINETSLKSLNDMGNISKREITAWFRDKNRVWFAVFAKDNQQELREVANNNSFYMGDKTEDELYLAFYKKDPKKKGISERKNAEKFFSFRSRFLSADKVTCFKKDDCKVFGRGKTRFEDILKEITEN